MPISRPIRSIYAPICQIQWHICHVWFVNSRWLVGSNIKNPNCDQLAKLANLVQVSPKSLAKVQKVCPSSHVSTRSKKICPKPWNDGLIQWIECWDISFYLKISKYRDFILTPHDLATFLSSSGPQPPTSFWIFRKNFLENIGWWILNGTCYFDVKIWQIYWYLHVFGRLFWATQL